MPRHPLHDPDAWAHISRMLRQGQLVVTGTKQGIGCVDEMRLSNARTPETDDLVDLTLADGRITDIVPATGTAPADGEDGLNLAGRLVLPGFVETHLHLDKAHLDSLEPNPDGTLAGAIAVTGRLKADFDHEGMAERARRVLDAAIAQRDHPGPGPSRRGPDRRHAGRRGARRAAPGVRRPDRPADRGLSPGGDRAGARHPGPDAPRHRARRGRRGRVHLQRGRPRRLRAPRAGGVRPGRGARPPARPARGLRRRRLRRALRDGLLHRPHHPRARLRGSGRARSHDLARQPGRPRPGGAPQGARRRARRRRTAPAHGRAPRRSLGRGRRTPWDGAAPSPLGRGRPDRLLQQQRAQRVHAVRERRHARDRPLPGADRPPREPRRPPSRGPDGDRGRGGRRRHRRRPTDCASGPPPTSSSSTPPTR